MPGANPNPSIPGGAQTADGGAARVRSRQVVLFCALVAVAMVALALWMSGSGGGSSAPVARMSAEIAGSDAAEDNWIQRSETRLGVLEGELREFERRNDELVELNRQLREEMDGNIENARNVIDRLSLVIEQSGDSAPPPVPPRIAALPDPGGDPFFTGGSAFAPPVSADRSTAPTPGGGIGALEATPSLIRRFALDEAAFAQPEEADAKPLSLWLPAGSHATAIVIAGVDASAGVVSQGDPRPVLLRVIGPAWTAAEDGAAQSVDLAGCTLTGAAYGELSSEKVYVRLQRLTCAGPESGTVVETSVAGFVAGMGKAGVRGPVVSREGALVERAFLAGLVSGAGQGVATAFSPTAIATGGNRAAVANTGMADIGRAGIGAGAGSAGTRVSDYLIRRAEQYQPVIQLRAGTEVTVVFLEGTRLDGRPVSNPVRSEQ